MWFYKYFGLEKEFNFEVLLNFYINIFFDVIRNFRIIMKEMSM